MKWPKEVIYQIFPDRFHCHDPAARPAPGAFDWNGIPIRVSSRKDEVTSREHHQYTFYGGTLQGIRQKLDYLQDLGATALYLTPIFKSRSTHRYDTDDYMQVDPILGTRADFDALLGDLHHRGMKLMLDGVFNHTSFHHRWFKEHPEYYMRAAGGQVETWMGSGRLPKLDVEHPELAKALLEIIDYWDGVDGWRLDASHLLARDFLKQLMKRVGPKRPIIGEDWDDARFDLHEGIYDGVTNFPFQRNVQALMVGDCSPETFTRRLRVVYEGYPWSGVVQSWSLLDNHDTDRFFDRIGGRGPQYRLSQVLQFTLPGTPLIYQGDEWGMTGRGDWGARAPMVWRPDAQAQDRFRHVRELARLRRDHPVLSTGGITFVHADNRARTLGFVREDTNERALVLINLGPEDKAIIWEGKDYDVASLDWRIVWL
jgi:cyclomaltodextrinase